MVGEEQTSSEDSERIRYFHAKYVSYSRAVGVMWSVLSICHLIITIVCLVQPSWLETSDESPNAAYFGIWKYAIADPIAGKMTIYNKTHVMLTCFVDLQ